MKKIILFTCILIGNFSFAQRPKIDSVLNLLPSSKEDTALVNRYVYLSFAYATITFNSDSIFLFGNKALALSQKLRWEKGQAASQSSLWRYYYRKGNIPKALSLALNSLKIFENLRDTNLIIDCLSGISGMYEEEDPERSLQYARKAYAIAKISNTPKWIFYTAGRIGAYFINMKMADSALFYIQQAYQFSNFKSREKDHNLAIVFGGLGRVQLLYNNNDLALSYGYKSLSYAVNIHGSKGSLIGAYQFLSDVFKAMGKKDSSLIYSERSLVLAVKENYPQVRLDAYKQLANIYKGLNNDSAVKYFEMEANLRDSLFTAKRKTEMASLSYNEEERQKELLATQQGEIKERQHNLQYAAIAIGIIIFVILFLLLSRSIIVKTKFIEFFGVLGLLAVFEFINLFIHPYLAHATNDSPVLMLVVLIAIGALLIPLHHKLEKWITKIMVEKNKKIRLAAAKKTIQQLEGEN